MQEYILKIKTLTDTMPGSGESVPGIADNDSLFDSNGFPCMNARTFKGHLREQMNEIQSVSDEYADIDIDSLLGARDKQGEKCHGRIYISNFSLPEAVRSRLLAAEADGEITPIELEDSLTGVYTSTKIDENGVADDHTLRKVRILNKGIEFEAHISTDDLSDKEEEFLYKSVKAVQHIGTYKSKGKGAVICSLEKIKENCDGSAVNNETVKDSSGTDVIYKIRLEEPLKMGGSGSQSNPESLSYIAGSTIRGMIIGRLISEGYLKEDDIPGFICNTFFTDSYPLASDGTPLIPCPSIFYATKQEKREALERAEQGNGFQIEVNCHIPYINSSGKAEADISKGEQVIGKGSSFCIKDGSVLQANVSKTGTLHIAIDKENRSKSQMFRYEAIAEDQAFIGKIHCGSPEDAEAARNTLNNQTVYIGGSRSSGYGRCHFDSVEIASNDSSSPEKIFNINKKKNTGTGEKILTVYALSNLIFLDENGCETGKPDTKYLETKLGIENLKLIESYASVFKTSGFNHTWKAGQVQRSAVSAGSVFFYTYTGEINEDAVRELESTGIGLRRQEGYGRIIINPDFGSLKSKGRLTLKKTSTVTKHLEDHVEMTESDIDQLRLIQESVNRERNSRSSVNSVLRCAEKNKSIGITRRQLTRLYTLLSDIASHGLSNVNAYDADKGRIETFWNELKTKTKEKYEMSEIVLNGKHIKLLNEDNNDLRNHLCDDRYSFEDFAGKDAFIDEDHTLKVTGETGHVRTGNDFYQKCRYLSEVIHYILRGEEKES